MTPPKLIPVRSYTRSKPVKSPEYVAVHDELRNQFWDDIASKACVKALDRLSEMNLDREQETRVRAGF